MISFARPALIRPLTRLLVLGIGAFACVATAAAGDPTILAKRYPELQQLLLAHDVLQAMAYEEIVLTNESPSAAIGQRMLLDKLDELEEKQGSHYHSAGNHLALLGPHRAFESRVTPGLLGVIYEQHDANKVRPLLADIGNLPPVALQTLQRGREFVEQLIEIHLNPEIEDKKSAVAGAVQRYLSDDAHSVASRPKSDELLSEHPYAYAYPVGFPQFSGLAWASQWLKIALLEIVITATTDAQLDEDVQRLIALYNEKLIRQHSGFVSLPADIPTSPVIAPTFYELYPDAAYILDNLESLKVVIGDVLAYPGIENRSQGIADAVAAYTDKRANLTTDDMKYLLFVLRGGIYNAGGPARGGLTWPDRNWSREQSENPHISISRQN
ncbi:MAG: hypothetical protein Q8L60_11430 [Gammaproteobacteria bacterium]|nr:hypothetical protein [Gammaproteobacteria bacterium]MDP2139842.1 hypothetical protein [Gammaproteobacteria bacterium]MDP2347083.1 hypothetical protein [Gammaproteobacteria bacterium]